MDPAFASVISKVQEEIKPLEDEIRPTLDLINEKKKFINQLCVHAKEPPMYPEVEGEGNDGVQRGSAPIRADQYFGRPVATVVKEILAPRKDTLGAIELDDLFAQMKAGGFAFDSKNDMLAKRGVSITLGKNPAFTKVPGSGCWGLTEWYPNAKRAKAMTSTTAEASDEEPTEETPSGDESGETSSATASVADSNVNN